ncbi:tetratricopeptide repeat-containing sensor histidine kinase [Aquimarina agarivorans]|uniref:tetratricopeptide repeat-containing sensor histidine kinase n=1 Tax=Aquimarina agarivorans TaxID=980584 RepID=UPI000248EA2E|nr:histidine kinase dimerization/phosphoacceptor domain -containing protein [Aquimarina agarivorans]
MFAQNKRVDSLLTILSDNNLPKKKQAKTLLDLAIYHPNPKNQLNYANKSLKIASEINDLKLQAEALEEICHNQRSIGNIELSLNAAFKALEYYKILNLEKDQAICYTLIASSYLVNKDYNAAISFFLKAKKYYLNKNKFLDANITLNLGETYRNKGNIDSAKICFKYVLNSNKLLKDDIIESYSLGNLGMVYNFENNLALAKQNLNKALEILKKLDDPYSTSVYIAELGLIEQKENNSALAEKKILKAYDMAKQAGLKEQLRDFSEMLTNLYEENQQFDKAFKYQKLFQIYQDSLVNKENIKKIEQLKASYEIEKRETEIGLLSTINKTQKKWVFSLGIGISLLLLLSYLLYRGNLNIKRKNQLLATQKEEITRKEQEKALLLKELNHRVKNNLQMISSLLSLQSNKLSGHPAQEAIITGKQRVEALSLVHRKLYQEGVDTRIHVKEYISELILGLFHGFNANFEPEFDIKDVSINIDSAIPLALIVNEIIINALKYAYVDIENPTLKVAIEPKSENRLSIEISDNGIGFDSSKTEAKTNSLGLKIINSLVLQLEGIIKRTTNNGTHWKMDVKVG